MRLENKAYIANDNGEAHISGHDDRMGFNHFLKDAKHNNLKHPPNIAAQPAQQTTHDINYKQRRKTDEPSPPARLWAAIWPLLLLAAILGVSYLSFTTTNPASQVLGLTALSLLTLCAAGLSAFKKAYRFQDVCILIMLAACFGVITKLGQNFGLDIFSFSKSSVWITASLIALLVAWSLKSRLALIISIALTVFWAYAVYIGNVNIGSGLFGLPIISVLQVLTAQSLGDGFSRRLSQFVLYGWGLTALIIAAMSGLTSVAFLLSALTLLTGFIYLSTTHPFHVWAQNQSRGIAVLSWFALMSCCLATLWVWLLPSAQTEAATLLTPMTDFIWQIGLIAGALALSAAALFRQTRTSHRVSRRIIGAIFIIAIAASHYFQLHPAAAGINDLGALYMMAGIALLGGLSVIAVSKFASSIRYAHNSSIVLSFLMIIALFISLVFIASVNAELLYGAGLAALVTIFGLSLTHKRPQNLGNDQAVYRPLRNSTARSNITRQYGHRRARHSPYPQAV